MIPLLQNKVCVWWTQVKKISVNLNDRETWFASIISIMLKGMTSKRWPESWKKKKKRKRFFFHKKSVVKEQKQLVRGRESSITGDQLSWQKRGQPLHRVVFSKWGEDSRWRKTPHLYLAFLSQLLCSLKKILWLSFSYTGDLKFRSTQEFSEHSF